MKKLILALVGIYSSVIVTTTAFAADVNNGQTLSATCIACHGEKGNSLAPSFPNIAGQTQQYLAKQLREIQSGERSVPTMMGQLDNMSAQDLEDIAAYYASQPRNYGAAKAELAELGETIYRVGIPRKNIASCAACHAPAGDGNGPAGFPALAGQWPEYTVMQLKAFQNGERHNDGDSQMMRSTAQDLTDKEMQAVASYLYGLK